MNAIIRWILVSISLTLMVFACSKDPVAPAGGDNPAPSLGINELILITASAPQAPDFSTGNRHTFELGSLSMVQNDEFGDFEISYTTTTSCDVDLDVYDFVLNGFEMLARAPGPGICSPVFTDQSHTLSEQALEAGDFLNDDDQMVVQVSRTPSVRALKLNPKYDPIALNPLDISATGIHVLGSMIWLAGENLHRVTTSGVKQADVTTTLDGHGGLAYDGELFWSVNFAGNPDGVFYGFTPQGDLACSFVGHNDFVTNYGMVYARDLLWVCNGSGGAIGAIDTDSACVYGQFPYPDDTEIRFPFPGAATAITYDGTNFYLAVDDNIKKMSPAGLELDSYPLTVERVIDMAYVAGSLWILHTGPRGVNTGGQFLTKFKL
jgi:hypothetical protein